MQTTKPQMPKAILVNAPVGAGQTEHALLDGASLVLGRQSDCDVVLSDAQASRMHARLSVMAGQVRVVDLGSRNGTFLNDRRVGSQAVAHGDRLRIGSTTFRVEIPSEDHFRKPSMRATSRVVLLRSPAATASSADETLDLTTHEVIPPNEAPEAALRRVRLDCDRVDWDGLRGATSVQRHPLAILDELGRHLNRATDLATAVRGLLRLVLGTFRAERTSLLLVPEGASSSDVEPFETLTREGRRFAPELSRSILREVIEDRVAVMSPDALADQRFAGDSIIMQRVRAVMCVPLETGEKAVGALYLDSTTLTSAFSESDHVLLAVIGKFAAEAILRLRTMERSRDTLLGAIRALVFAVEAKDTYTAGHSERVSDFAVAVAQELELPERECRDIRLAGLLHDIGKIGVPEAILHNPGRLTEEEYKAIQEHPERGARILEHLDGLACVIQGVRHHHERWDGSGYPRGLCSTTIPRIARIISVVDAVDAMSSGRPYMRTRTLDELVLELESCKGRHFDPELAEVAAACLRKGTIVPHALAQAVCDESGFPRLLAS